MNWEEYNELNWNLWFREYGSKAIRIKIEDTGINIKVAWMMKSTRMKIKATGMMKATRRL